MVRAPAAFKKAWFTPVFSTFLAHRLESLILAGLAVVQLGMHALGLPGWVCPIKAVLGIPCPGCGLTLALDELLHGHWLESIRTHAFAPVFALAFLILFVNLLLPARWRAGVVKTAAALEARTGLTAWVLSLLMVYWCIRLFGLV